MPTAEQVTLNTAEYDSQSSKRLEELIRERGPEIAFSGLARFAFSASHLQSPDLRDVPDLTAFIEQFASTPLTVDFKKTRNSRHSRDFFIRSRRALRLDGKKRNLFQLQFAIAFRNLPIAAAST